MKKIDVKMLTKLSIIAALYVAITLALQPLSYGAIQFRISEALMLLVIYNPLYSISLILGCFVSNFASGLGAWDILFGTLATAIACIPMIKIKNIYVSSLFPSIVNGIIIGLELYFLWEIPLYLGMTEVFLGEFVVCTLVGIPLFRSFEKNTAFMDLLEIKPLMKKNKASKFLDIYTSLMLAVVIVNAIMFFNMGLYTVITDDVTNRYTLFRYATAGYDIGKSYGVLFLVLFIPVISLIITKFTKKYVSLIINSVISVAGLALVIYAIVISKSNVEWFFYTYILVFVVSVVISVFKFKKEIKTNIEFIN